MNAPEAKSDREVIGALRVWWIPQVPGKPFYVPVASVREARLVIDTLADYDLFQLDNNIKPDFCNAGGLQVYEADDGEGTPGWCDWLDADGYDIDESELARASIGREEA